MSIEGGGGVDERCANEQEHRRHPLLDGKLIYSKEGRLHVALYVDLLGEHMGCGPCYHEEEGGQGRDPVVVVVGLDWRRWGCLECVLA